MSINQKKAYNTTSVIDPAQSRLTREMPCSVLQSIITVCPTVQVYTLRAGAS